VISERGKAAKNNTPEGASSILAQYGGSGYPTVRARQWVLPSSEEASGTVTLVTGWALIGVIVRSKMDMDKSMWNSGHTNWFYRTDGAIWESCGRGPGSGYTDWDDIGKMGPSWQKIRRCNRRLRVGLREVKDGDTITVDLKDGILSFKVNDTVQPHSIDLTDLPVDTQVTLAVSLYHGDKVRLT